MNNRPDAIDRANYRALTQRAYFLFGTGWNSVEIARHLAIGEAFALDLIHEGRRHAREPER